MYGLFSCSQIKNEIEKFKLQGIELEDQRKRILKELEDKQTVCSKEADEYEKKHTEISKIIDQLRRGGWPFTGNFYLWVQL